MRSIVLRVNLLTEYIHDVLTCTHHNIQSDLMRRGRECQIHVGEASIVSSRDARNVRQRDEHLIGPNASEGGSGRRERGSMKNSQQESLSETV